MTGDRALKSSFLLGSAQPSKASRQFFCARGAAPRAAPRCIPGGIAIWSATNFLPVLPSRGANGAERRPAENSSTGEAALSIRVVPRWRCTGQVGAGAFRARKPPTRWSDRGGGARDKRWQVPLGRAVSSRRTLPPVRHRTARPASDSCCLVAHRARSLRVSLHYRPTTVAHAS